MAWHARDAAVSNPSAPPQFSVVVPVYRTGTLAVRAVESALAQVGVTVEVIAVDDGSGDETATLLKAIADPRFRLVEQPDNRGAAAARNHAIARAGGEWIALLDSDDWFAPNRLASLLDTASATDADMVADDLRLVPHGATAHVGRLFGGRMTSLRMFDTAAFVRAATRGDATFVTAGLIKPILRRAFLERHDLRYHERLTAHEDYHFYVRCLLRGATLGVVPEAYYFYTTGRPGALTVGRRVVNADQALAANSALLEEASTNPEVRAALQAQARTLEDNQAIQRVREPLVAGRLGEAWRQALDTPRFIPAGLRRLAPSARTGPASAAVVTTNARSGRIRVTHVITDLETGGAQQMLVNLLAATDRTHVDHDVVSLGPTGPMAERIASSGVPVRCLDLRRTRPNPLVVSRLGAWLRSRQSDVVHGWLTHANLAAGLAARAVRYPQVIWSLHTSLPTRPDVRQTTRWALAACRMFASSLPARIVSCSESGARAHVDVGYPSDRMSVIPNACDTDRFAPSPSSRRSVRQELGIPEDAVIIGQVARFHVVKDHATSIAAMGQLLRRHPATHFLLCGDGINAANATLMRWIREAGIERQCRLLGRRSDMERLAAAFDIATSTSSHGEACPLVLIEAMSSGVSCVTTDVGDARLLLGGTGQVVSPRSPSALVDAWSALIDAGNEGRTRAGQAARQRILERYSLPAIVSQYEALYGELTRRRQTAFAMAPSAGDDRGHRETHRARTATSSAPAATHRVE